MTTAPKKEIKVTYASLAAGSEEMHQAYEEAIPRVQGELGRVHPFYVRDEPRTGLPTTEDRSPADTRQVLGLFQKARAEDVQDAVAAARAAYPGWSGMPLQDRLAIMRKAADWISERKFDLAVLMSLEAGKNRFEALGDVEEAADLIRYYCQQMEEAHGFVMPMGSPTGPEKTRSVLKSWGAWAVIAPFNFPLALATGMAAGALIAGNTVVFKPATDTPFLGLKLYEALRDAGLPAGVFNYVSGSGSVVGEALISHPGIDGVAFTGSRDVGVKLFREFGEKAPRPCITEMGGKNPAIVTARADLDKAVEGIARSAFGFCGQKCSACSRVYVHRSVAGRFVDLLLERTRKMKVGYPLERDTFMGPVINQNAYRNYQEYIKVARDHGRVPLGGEVISEDRFQHGYYVQPTVVVGLPKDHRFFFEELFLPILCVAEVDSLEEALELSNRSEYGLTAGIFSEDPQEVQTFFDRMEAGVLYANRRGGATTGAWPGVQSFGGWKLSGSTGKGACGPYYVQQFLREQSQTIAT
ncbi:MAG: aldehyde dehydrogenase family protein [Acidobacteria bacterium]|nr:aldehyde dehydrogenase family protein [Acidobacteriota bacterium]